MKNVPFAKVPAQNDEDCNPFFKLSQDNFPGKVITFLTTLFVLCFYSPAWSQVSLSADGSSPDPTAILDLKSTTQGFLMPRMTTVQRNAIVSPAPGLLVFDITTSEPYYYNGTIWLRAIDSQGTWIKTGDNLNSAVLGNVGIGVPVPLYKLDINGDINLAASQSLRQAGVQWVSAKGTENIYAGLLAGNVSTGAFNAFLGCSAGLSNIGGSVNTFIGHSAGRLNVSSGYNTFIGAGAGKEHLAGEYNVYVGSNCGFSNSGERNVFVGDFAGRYNLAGNYNTLIGQGAGYHNATGSGNVFLGAGAGANSTGDNKLYVENTESESPLIYGEFNNDLVKINGKLGINTVPVRSLQVKDVMRLEPTTIAPAAPLEGDIYMNGTTHKLMVFDGALWQACW